MLHARSTHRAAPTAPACGSCSPRRASMHETDRDRPATTGPAWLYEHERLRRGAGSRRRRVGVARIGGDQRAASRRATRSPRSCPAILRSVPTARLRIFRCGDFTDPYYALRREEPGADGRRSPPRSRPSTRRSREMPYLTGRAFGLADIAYVPWVIRARDLLGVVARALRAPRRLARALSRAPLGRRRDRPSSRASL